jgi:O-succinylbenzoic acid--CoA ligase
MLPIHAWLRRADPRAPALVLPDAAVLSFGDLAGTAGRDGLSPLAGGAGEVARGLIEAALGGGTAFPLPPGFAPGERERLLALAARAARPRLALIVASSGSTGLPKGVRLHWRAVAAAARMSARGLDLRAGDVWLACLPLHHVGGALILYRCLRAGATAVVHEGFDVGAVARDLAARRVTHVSLVPPMLAQLLDAAVPPGPTLRCALVGGAALTPALLDRARAAGWPVRLSYGMTETCATALVDGRPLPGVRVRADADGRLAIATPARMAGYLGADGRVPEWIATNDLGTVDAEGRAHVAGRADDMLVSAGVNVHPLEIEARLAACPGVRESGVTGLADPVWGDVIACAYEGETHEGALADWCRAHLPSARRPRRFLRVERLPRTASGKLDRRALPGLWA